MGFLTILWAESGPLRKRLLTFMVLAGVSMAIMMAIVNTVADRRSAEEEINFELLVIFFMAAAVVILAQNRAMIIATQVCEGFLKNLRLRLTHLVRRTRMAPMEQLGQSRIYDIIARDTTTISEAAQVAAHGMISSLALIMASVYVAILSPLAFAVIVVLFSVNIYYVFRGHRKSRISMAKAREGEDTFFGLLYHLLLGFKEVKLHAPRGDDLENNHIVGASQGTETLKIESARTTTANMSLSYATFYLLLATVTFALPQYLDSPRTAMKVIYVVIFMLSTIEVVLKALPMLVRSSLAIDSLNTLESRLEEAAREADATETSPSFHILELRDLIFAHTGPDGKPAFTVGPCSLTITPGEIIFIGGGNGSGKSTFLRLLTRLYEPCEGSILWDGNLVDESTGPDYRNLFSAVFADFHLFDRLYGMTDISDDTVDAMIADMGLGKKTALEDGAFTTLDLSTGQRKRLAMIVALLEDRPICVFDELAADQDPAFRKRFYEKILPGLKAAGKTIVVASHDDRYFHVADHLLTMEDGRFREEKKKK